ncbi:MAG: trypsin-like peptidase domain-containing protein [Clostridia bacterium]|nr:trypsin-like peptidase domain-containing protein [Clostridia bacterium]
MYTYKKKKTKKNIIVMMLVFIVLFSLYMLLKMYTRIEPYKRESIVTEKLSASVESLEENDVKITDVIDKVNSSVVGISKIKEMGNNIFSYNGTGDLGLGTGMIVTENGYILTNEHVSGKKYANCYVTLDTGETCNGSVVWADEEIDLAIVKIMKNKLPVIELGNSEVLKVGETVYAIGNPIGYEFQRTVTSGIISALDRVVKLTENEREVFMSNLIQTDATINPGNSGGPLIDIEGKVVGINSVKITSAESIGFAIPINIVKPIINTFLQEGDFEEAGIGIFAYDKNIIPYINANINFEEGIYVEQVKVNSAAYKSGLEKGDIIIQIDDKKIKKMCELREYIYTKKVGEKVNLQVLRNNKVKNIEIFLLKK